MLRFPHLCMNALDVRQARYLELEAASSQARLSFGRMQVTRVWNALLCPSRRYLANCEVDSSVDEGELLAKPRMFAIGG